MLPLCPLLRLQQILLLNSGRGTRRRAVLLGAGAAAALVALLLFLLSLGPRYVLVIDAGSSGTRMYAYTWRSGGGGDGAPRLAAVPSSAAPHKVPRRALPSKRAYQRVETEPGLDRFSGTDVDGLQDRALGAWRRHILFCCGWRVLPSFSLLPPPPQPTRAPAPALQARCWSGQRLWCLPAGGAALPSSCWAQPGCAS